VKIDEMRIGENDLGMPLSDPVDIFGQTGDSVTFNVKQAWKEGGGGLSWISVHYDPYDPNKPVFLKSEEVPWKTYTSEDKYTAKCVDRQAVIDVYVHDGTFKGAPEITDSIPKECSPSKDKNKKVHFKLIIPCAHDSSFCTDDPFHELCEKSAKAASDDLATNNVECGTTLFEDYETPGQSESWTGGLTTDGGALTSFLGRLGKQHSEVSKTFKIDKNADKLILTFDFYDIDGMPSSDKIMMGVQGSFFDLDLFDSSGDKTYYNDVAVTQKNKKSRSIAFKADSDDTIYSMWMKIPKHWYKDYEYELPITFRIETDRDGIDNFKIEPSCDRRRERELDSEEFPVSEPDQDGDDGSYYCLSKDFPCEGGEGMVHACHYSTRLGYQTFCIPEADSEVLRFYSNDYCGPCVGGFGGANLS
jgi:hypothetical protein